MTKGLRAIIKCAEDELKGGPDVSLRWRVV